MRMQDVKIDFVLPWVDGNDPEWRKSFLAHLPESGKSDDTREVRYRDWGLLRYWFRGVERFAPWVNKIHFITCGHYPDWLDLNHPKLNFVRHEDYIPSECLPTFNSNSIELSLYRLEALADRFVLFNDDTFLVGKVNPERFFYQGLPCDIAAFDVVASTSPANKFAHTILNNVSAINQRFRKREVLRRHPMKWFHPLYGVHLFRNIALLPWPYFTGFINPHLPNAYLRSTLMEVWESYGDLLAEACTERFRSVNDYSDWLFRYWQLVKGDFHPINVFASSAYMEITERTLPRIERAILRQEKPILVLNDAELSGHVPFEVYQKRLLAAFQRILPEKSTFEKD